MSLFTLTLSCWVGQVLSCRVLFCDWECCVACVCNLHYTWWRCYNTIIWLECVCGIYFLFCLIYMDYILYFVISSQIIAWTARLPCKLYFIHVFLTMHHIYFIYISEVAELKNIRHLHRPKACLSLWENFSYLVYAIVTGLSRIHIRL